MMKDKPPAKPSKGKGKARLLTRMETPPCEDWENAINFEESFPYGFNSTVYHSCDASREAPVSLGDSGSIHDPYYNFDKSDSDTGTPSQIGTLEMRMNDDETPYRDWNVDDDIADAAGISAMAKGKQRERQVPLSCCNKHLLY
jgi:hypothetical protein